MSVSLGRFGENWAAGHLTRLGYRIVDRNVRYRSGELDLVAYDGEELVFVEVKCRRSRAFGSPQSSITPRRFAHLAATIEQYIAEREMSPLSYRLDVVAVEVDAHGTVIRHEVLVGVQAPTW